MNRTFGIELRLESLRPRDAVAFVLRLDAEDLDVVVDDRGADVIDLDFIDEFACFARRRNSLGFRFTS